MTSFMNKYLTHIFFIIFAISLVDFAFLADDADARSRGGGRSFSKSRSSTPPASKTTSGNSAKKSSSGGAFTRGLAGGLLGGAIGSMIFGGLAQGGQGGLGGSGIGLFQILIFGGIAYFIYRKFFKRPAPSSAQSQQPSPMNFLRNLAPGGEDAQQYSSAPSSKDGGNLQDGIEMIRSSEPDFDPEHFKEIAQDVFFQVQAGWMRRDVQSYRHLLGDKLAAEYDKTFAQMRIDGHINKLENIAVRKVEVVDAGIDNNEEFISLLFTANLLDYTVDENSGDLINGSMTEPIKFVEKWTWARKIGTENWQLEGVGI